MFVITLGDPFSINIDLLLSYLEEKKPIFLEYPLVIVGSQWHWKRQIERLGRNLSYKLKYVYSWSEVGFSGGWFLSIPETNDLCQDVEKLSSYLRGKIAYLSLKSLSFLRVQENLAVLTCPIEKSSVYQNGFSFTGQTEFFESLWEGESSMLMLGEKLKVGLVTNHLALNQVASELDAALIFKKLEILFFCLKKFYRIESPRIGICGLNPHAGENGNIGFEDKEIIEPVICNIQKKYPEALFSGPHAADTLFWQAANGHYDAVLAMYHDQGLVPIKTLEFTKTVNFTAGLKHFRASPAHGPAKDFFLKDGFEKLSFARAFKLAEEYLYSRRNKI